MKGKDKMKAWHERQASDVHADRTELVLQEVRLEDKAWEQAEEHNMPTYKGVGNKMAVELQASGRQLNWLLRRQSEQQFECFEEDTSEEDRAQGSGRSEDTPDMVCADGLQVWDPEEVEFDLQEAL